MLQLSIDELLWANLRVFEDLTFEFETIFTETYGGLISISSSTNMLVKRNAHSFQCPCIYLTLTSVIQPAWA